MTILRSLLASDISDLDKAMMCFNLAVVYDKMGRVTDALAWYDEGIAYERAHGRFYVTEQKAVYLAQMSRVSESLRVYKELLTHSYLTESDKERIRTNVKLLQERGA